MEFDQLVKAHSGQIKKVINDNMRHSNMDHDDVYQEVLIKLWKHVNEFKGESSLSTWLYTIIVNTIIDYKRVNYKEVFVDIANLNPKSLPNTLKEFDNPEYILDRKEALNKLSPKKQKIFKLYQEGKNKKEIASMLNLPIGTISSNIVRIKRELRKDAINQENSGGNN
jgi:RNA polymerase sigma-70 factor, ECF subfamily